MWRINDKMCVLCFNSAWTLCVSTPVRSFPSPFIFQFRKPWAWSRGVVESIWERTGKERPQWDDKILYLSFSYVKNNHVLFLIKNMRVPQRWAIALEMILVIQTLVQSLSQNFTFQAGSLILIKLKMVEKSPVIYELNFNPWLRNICWSWDGQQTWEKVAIN